MKKIILLRHGESVWNLENRFTSWTDVDLTENGIHEAQNAGILMKDRGLVFDIAYTSYLKRAIKTVWFTLEMMDLAWIPIDTTVALNERHYGALQGQNKDEAAKQYGEKQVLKWRRYPNEEPPPLERSDPRFPGFELKYQHLNQDNLPLGENLQQTADRTIAYWKSDIEPAVLSGKNVLLVAHNNTIRALIQHKENLSDEETVKLEIEMSRPIVYEFYDELKNPLDRYYLE